MPGGAVVVMEGVVVTLVGTSTVHRHDMALTVPHRPRLTTVRYRTVVCRLEYITVRYRYGSASSRAR